jgi:hypothetical protein
MDLIDANKKRLQQNMDIYRKRQAIVEHPFGVIKRQWDFYYVMTKKSMKHASADVGLIFTCYNLRRVFNLIDQNALKKFFRELSSPIFTLKSHFKKIQGIFNFQFMQTTIFELRQLAFRYRLYLSKNSLFWT